MDVCSLLAKNSSLVNCAVSATHAKRFAAIHKLKYAVFNLVMIVSTANRTKSAQLRSHQLLLSKFGATFSSAASFPLASVAVSAYSSAVEVHSVAVALLVLAPLVQLVLAATLHQDAAGDQTEDFEINHLLDSNGKI